MKDEMVKKVKACISAFRPIAWIPFLFSSLFGMIEPGFNDVMLAWFVLFIVEPMIISGIYVVNLISDSSIDRKSKVVKDIVMAKQPFATGTCRKIEGIILSLILFVSGLYLSARIELDFFHLDACFICWWRSLLR